MNIYKIIFTKGAFVFFIALTSCSKLLEVESPRNHLTTDKVFSDSLSVIAALGNAYYTLANNVNNNYGKHLALYSDEFIFPAQNNDFHIGRIEVNNSTNANLWRYFYEIIYFCNDFLTRENEIEAFSDKTKKALMNETKFIRAFSYYHLYTLFENIPLILTTHVDENRNTPQADSSTVFTQIISDLNDAKNGLPSEYPSVDRARANKWAARALLAQVYLYQHRWQEALDEANAVLVSGMYSLNEDINSVFLANSEETILQLWRANGFISDATSLIPASRTTLPQYIITEELLSAYESGDLRKSNWFGENVVTTDGISHSYYFPYKYKSRSASNSAPEYLILSRLSEQYLIRAEAKAHLNDSKGAIDDLNKVRKRGGLSELTDPKDKERCLEAIYHERRVELFGEWAKRFVDLKRTGRINDVMGKQKDTWKKGISERLPIPFSEILYNTKLKQNEGYN